MFKLNAMSKVKRGGKFSAFGSSGYHTPPPLSSGSSQSQTHEHKPPSTATVDHMLHELHELIKKTQVF